MKRIKSIIFLLLLYHPPLTSGNEIYLVKKDDALSKVVQNLFPDKKIYGEQGQLKKILDLNNHITNSNLIYPNQIIFLSSIVEIDSKDQNIIVSIEKKVENSRVPTANRRYKKKLNLLVAYGAKYFSFNQEGVPGSAKVGEIFFNNFKINLAYRPSRLLFEFQGEAYQFKYKNDLEDKSKSFSSFAFLTSYNWFIFGIHLKSYPLFRRNWTDNVGHIEIIQKNHMLFSMAFQKKFYLKFLEMKFHLGPKYAVNEGVGFNGGLKFVRHISSFFNIVGDITSSYQNLKQDIEWENLKGEVKSKIVETTLNLGFELTF